MKKITLLVATLLAVYGNAFGQNMPKVLWEKSFLDINENYLNYVPSPNIFIRESESGNIILQCAFRSTYLYGKDNVSVYNKNGELIWQKPSESNSYYDIFTYGSNVVNLKKYLMLIKYNNRLDSTFYLDKKDFKIQKGFAGQVKLDQVESGGLIDTNTDSLTKYDDNINVQWTYKENGSKEYYVMGSNQYLCAVRVLKSNKYVLQLLDKNGKKVGESDIGDGVRAIPTKDGLWMEFLSLSKRNFTYVNFDSTGKKTGTYTTSNVNGIYSALPDNSLLLFADSTLINISPNGVKRELPSTIFSKNDYLQRLTYKFSEAKNSILFINTRRKTNGDIVYNIGEINLQDFSETWRKDLVAGNYYNLYKGNFVKFMGDTFFEEFTTKSDSANRGYRVYGQDGKMKWESKGLVLNDLYSKELFKTKGFSPVYESFNYSKINDHLYVYANNSKNELFKIRYSDGKAIWKREGINLNSKYFDFGPLKIDNRGDELLINNNDNKTYFLEKLNTDGSATWSYPIPFDKKLNESKILNPNLSINNANKGFIYYTSTKGDSLQFIFQKISLCNYNFSTDPRVVTGITQIISDKGLTEACPTEKIKISATKYDGAVYEWQKDGKILPTLKASEHEMSESGTYKLTIKDTVCQYSGVSNELKINIRSLPITGISTTKSIICEGEKTTIAAQTNGAIFQWQKDEKDITNATGTTYEASLSGNYRVGVRGDKCPQIGYSNLVTINAKPLPEAMISTDVKGVVYASSIKLSANSGAGLSYQWLKNDSLLANETTAIYETKISGKYAVKVSKEGCAKTSEPLLISILVPLANEVELGEEQVQVYPNPSNGNFKIVLPKSLKGSDIQLLDSFGRERSLIHTDEQTHADGLVQGMYFLKVSKNGKVVTSKVVIE
jgi:Secretion system C-terminal sorting domain